MKKLMFVESRIERTPTGAYKIDRHTHTTTNKYAHLDDPKGYKNK